MTPAAQIVPPTTCKAISLHSVIAPIFTNVRTNASLELSPENVVGGVLGFTVVAVEARHSACRESRSAKRNPASFEALHSATALSGN